MKIKKFGAALLAFMLMTTNVAALEGEMGYFGGITPGTKLPTSIELAQEDYQVPANYTLPYKEVVYLSGDAVEVEGTITVQSGMVGIDFRAEPTGSYTESYVINATSPDGRGSVTRNMTLTTQYVYNEGLDQLIKSSRVTNWNETVAADGSAYTLDQASSHFTKSIIEEHTPGVTYYSGDVYYKAVYNQGDSPTTMEVNSRIYGYDQAFAKTETQVRTISIDDGEDQYFIKETPSITMNKEIFYSSNEPYAISFAGNYKELIQGYGAVKYDILVGNDELRSNQMTGVVGVDDTFLLDQMALPSLSQLQGHPARTDIEKLYSMGIYDVNPIAFSPNQAITRGEYITMLVKTLGIELPDVTSRRAVLMDFEDVAKTDPNYQYIYAAYNAGLINSTTVNPDDYITREELIVFNVRALGLQRLGLGIPTIQTSFMDDSKISNYAKSSLYVAGQIGIIPNSNGYIFPDMNVSYADCAVFLNLFIDYLRYGLQKDYNQMMML
ncbi:MAG: hypothetical protein BEN18_09985 [Epulopiscium sp. Nuni2H_MBin001]|nr:MAG: hypothetical protein BEN18_09985 [Epulopiscium sp. Nuni2H_MBin001]